MTDDAKTCFCICPIGPANSPIRRRSDQVIKYLIREAVPSRYKVIRADDLPRPGVITSQVFGLLQSADLVVADLSTANANVFYELAIRHVTRKPVIQLLADDESLPFDVAPIRTIPFNIHDLDSVDRAKRDLTQQVEYLELHPEVDTPVSVAIQLGIAETSDEPIAKLVTEMARTLGQLSDDVRQLKAGQIYYSYPAGGVQWAGASPLTNVTAASLNADAFTVVSDDSRVVARQRTLDELLDALPGGSEVDYAGGVGGNRLRIRLSGDISKELDDRIEMTAQFLGAELHIERADS